MIDPTHYIQTFRRKINQRVHGLYDAEFETIFLSSQITEPFSWVRIVEHEIIHLQFDQYRKKNLSRENLSIYSITVTTVKKLFLPKSKAADFPYAAEISFEEIPAYLHGLKLLSELAFQNPNKDFSEYLAHDLKTLIQIIQTIQNASARTETLILDSHTMIKHEDDHHVVFVNKKLGLTSRHYMPNVEKGNEINHALAQYSKLKISMALLENRLREQTGPFTQAIFNGESYLNKITDIEFQKIIKISDDFFLELRK